jgi:nicotinate-nucleotide--dimethylbenzimidazole phosphoribosyltransferase
MSKTQLHNPWKGVVPYTGDPEDLRLHPFRGRDKDIEKLLDIIDAKPLLNLGLRLGEGTGALCAYPIVDSAVRMINEMNYFKDARITKYF